jgi:hypothetical protein
VTIVKWGFYSSETRKSGFESESIALSRSAESQTLRNGVICYGFLKTILLLVYSQNSIVSVWHITCLNSNIWSKLAEHQIKKHWKNSHQFQILHILQFFSLWIFTHVHTIPINLLFEPKFVYYGIVIKGQIFIACSFHLLNWSSWFSAVIMKARHKLLRNQDGIIQNT